MKKKGPRSVPDFSRKQKGRPDASPVDANAPAPRVPRDLTAKPKAGTTKAGGRRGS
jgi:hypothetical protein